MVGCITDFALLSLVPMEINNWQWRYAYQSYYEAARPVTADNHYLPASPDISFSRNTLRFFEKPAGKPLVIFFGGAMDSSNLNMKQVADGYHDKSKSGEFPVFDQDKLYFGQGDAEEAKIAILEKVKSDPQTVIALIGHSWGGDTAYKIVRDLAAHGLEINLLVTLDPVSVGSYFKSQFVKPSGTTNWINFHVPKSDLASLGGHWGEQNDAFDVYLPDLTHIDAPRMFAKISDQMRIFEACSGQPNRTTEMQQKWESYYNELKKPSNLPNKKKR